jgi:hypothetical protein
MLPRGTVFVLGAGASAPYGLPTGAKLQQAIVDALRIDGHHLGNVARDATGISSDLMRAVGHDIERAGLASVDEWCDLNRDDAPLVKAVMAAILLEEERGAALVPGQPGFKGERDWMGYLLRHVITNPAAGLESVGVVTFNFDRTLEHRVRHMLHGLRRRQDISVALEALKLEVVHVSGTLGPLGWPGDDEDKVVQFGAGADGPTVHRAAKQVVFLYEDRAQDPLARANQLIARAHVVAFIGFAFHQSNVACLQIEKYSADPGARFVGSACGMTSAEARQREAQFPHRTLHLYEECDALHFLRSVPELHGGWSVDRGYTDTTPVPCKPD